ncbi:pyridoxal phosphate-dependent aminotransferase [Candidatus Halocynthiibacter alkanivorans]|uniref:pyridoxal phosphate-dependent aminotransferase n=1 Tax=Candidatus Halocynthiibacter alkanivorans TaxID=2267619 RepID=UPI000DF38CC8|nr:pyridoxal phosphate-dependent aminotransferase [Candidatus Halocynthiibacter alkanivorans]
MDKWNLTDLAAALPASVPFVGPETQERARGRAFDARLGANENGFGPSPRATAAMAEAATGAWMYGDPESYDLRQALSAHHGIPPENIMVGEGIDGLLGYLVRLFIAPGDRVVTSDGGYPTFNYHVAGFGGEIHKVPYKGDEEDPVALLQKGSDVGAKLIYLANPDNPMGSWHDAATIQAAIDAVPAGSLLVLDEAYMEFAPEDTAPPFNVSDPKLIRFRTFSKAYGLAGARVGYAIAHADLITAFNKVRNHFGMARPSQAAALAALVDQPHLQQTRDRVSRARAHITQIAADNGLTALPSATNFVAVDCGEDGDFARRVLTELTALNLFVRMPFVAPQDRCIRISAAPEAELDLFAAALPKALQAARQA